MIFILIQILQQDSKDDLFVPDHSRGGVYIGNALKLLTPEERKMIHVYTFGFASLFQDTGLASLVYHVAPWDPIPLTDPINYLKARFVNSSSSNVHFLQSKGNIFSNHLMDGDIYAEQRIIDDQKILERIRGY